MTNRVATVFGAALLGYLTIGAAPAVLAAPADGATADAEACLAAPKGAAPKGERWYYRVERSSKRHCWYTRAATPRNVAARPSPDQQPAEPAAADVADSTPVAAPPRPVRPVAAPQPPAPLQSAVANARAEIAPVTDTAASAAPSPFPPPPTVAAPANERPAATAAAVTDRWPDQPVTAQAAPLDQPATAAPTPAAQPAPRAAASQSETTALWILLSVIGGVLATVGIVTALIRTFASSTRYARREDNWTASRWQQDEVPPDPRIADLDDAPVMQSDLTKMELPPMNWVRIARERTVQPDDEIEQLLARRVHPAA